MSNIPFHLFLASLATNGIRLTVRDYELIQLALQTGGVWTISRLRNSLLVLLAKNPEQQESFIRRFEQWFHSDSELDERLTNLDIQHALGDLRQLAQKQRIPHKPEIPPKVREEPLSEPSTSIRSDGTKLL